jgi:hypothetical protein
MSVSRIAALLAGLLLVTMFANAATRNTIRIAVLDSETRSSGVDDNNGVPLNCEQLTFDAYCRSSRTAPLVNTLLVQEGNNPPFRISCTAESKMSKCTPLPKGETFDARREKKGVVVYYLDDKGKVRSQLYTVVAGDAKGKAAAATPAGNTAPAVPAAAGATPASAASAENPAQAPVQSSGQTPSVVVATSRPQETVKCSFTSTPAGAEVTVDGRYVGSTPSALGLTTGTHVVVVSMAGFTQWKRELAVEAGSELTVNAVLEKAQ